MTLKPFNFSEHLQRVLSDADLPSVVNLGLYLYIDGAWVPSADHNKLTEKQFEQLLSKLGVQTHVEVLNLGGSCVGVTPGPEMCQRIAAAFTSRTDLKVFQVGGTSACN